MWVQIARRVPVRESAVDARLHERIGRQFALQVQHLFLEPTGLALGRKGLFVDGKTELEPFPIHLACGQRLSKLKLKGQQAIHDAGWRHDWNRNVGFDDAEAKVPVQKRE